MRFCLAAIVIVSLVGLFACTSKPSGPPSKPLTKVEAAAKTLVDLNATQNQVTKDLIAMRNQLLSMPKDSPPTREITRKLSILNKRAADVTYNDVIIASAAAAMSATHMGRIAKAGRYIHR